MSRSADAAVGMMEGAYFVGRKELLDFFNDLLDLNLTKIEQTASGAVACQLTEMIFPGSIPMSKVDWGAKSDYEFVQNYKLLQSAFNKHHVQRHVDVDKLIRAKYQDNLEFTQWLKAFYEQSGVYRDDYDPQAVRAKGKGIFRWENNGGRSDSRSTAAHKGTSSVFRGSRPLRERPAVNDKPSSSNSLTLSRSRSTEAVMADAELMKKNADLTTKVEDLEQAVLDIEKERDFYFEKLRNVEILLQVHQEKESEDADADMHQLVEKVFKVLYATADDSVAVDDEGNVVDFSDVSAEVDANAV